VFSFKGVNQYLEDLLSRFDAPQLYRLETTFFNDTHFDTAELNRFISHMPTFGELNEAHFTFRSHEALVRLSAHLELSDHGTIEVKIFCQEQDQQLSSLAQICTLSLRLFSTMEYVYIQEDLYSPPNWKDIESAKWLHLLLPFTAVKDLYVSKRFETRIGTALQELTGRRITEVWPTLQNLFLDQFDSSDLFHEGIRQLISARQLTNRPLAISFIQKGEAC
jgi:hypothetical protein